MAEANFIYAGSLTSNQVIKFDSNGNDLWTYSASIYDLVVDSNDNVIIGDGSIVRKLDSNGSTLWTNSNHTSLVNLLSTDSLDNVISAAFDNTIRKYNSSGNQQWVYSTSQTVRSLDTDPFNNILASLNNGDVIKLDPDSNLLWTYSHTGTIPMFGLDADNEGNVYFGDNGGELVKLDSNGNFVWANNDHNGAINNLSVDNNPFIYTASSDDTVRKFDSNGNQVWSYTGFSNDVRAISVDLAGNVYAGSENQLRKIDSSGNGVWLNTDITENIWSVDVYMPYTFSSPIKLGETDIFDIYKGSTLVDRAYKGGTLFFGDPPPILYELIADVEVTSNTTQIDFDNLNITKDDELRLVYTLVGDIANTASEYRFFPNNLTTNSNYYTQIFLGNGSGFTSVRVNSNFSTSAASNRKSVGFADIKVSNNDRFVVQSQNLYYVGSESSNINNRNFNVVGTETVSSITKLSIVASRTGGIATSSRLQLYKVNKGVA